ncbi:hypothetical protein SMAC4_13180 [Sordaria macrospora]|uniref:uncharacterized protein n=1 Tax=Sordaria macrospora TaxID=5147 RepID=UPI002B321DC9|nr:hypothetical protein SMAC4_13180 [Sordaria macrospora]
MPVCYQKCGICPCDSTCVVDPLKSNSCSECVRRKTSCDDQDVTRRLYQSMKDAKRLEEEEDKLLRSSVEIKFSLGCCVCGSRNVIFRNVRRKCLIAGWLIWRRSLVTIILWVSATLWGSLLILPTTLSLSI